MFFKYKLSYYENGSQIQFTKTTLIYLWRNPDL